MKSIKLFGLLLMATLVFASCSKDDDEDVINVSGTTWESTYMKYSLAAINIEYKTVAELKEADEYTKFTFNSDGTITSEGEVVSNWEQSGNQITFIDLDKDETVYTLSGNTLTYAVSANGVTSTMKFTKI